MIATKFLADILSNFDIKEASFEDYHESDGEITCLYIIFKKPFKFDVKRKEGFSRIICDAVEICINYVTFVIDDADVLVVKWEDLDEVSWNDCPMEEYKKEIEKTYMFV